MYRAYVQDVRDGPEGGEGLQITEHADSGLGRKLCGKDMGGIIKKNDEIRTRGKTVYQHPHYAWQNERQKVTNVKEELKKK